jgi:hypothetical protein
MKTPNTHTTRESWLRAATDELRSDFKKLGYSLPEKIRFAIAFTSTGKRGHIPGECWHPEASDDQHYEVIIRADIAEPVEVLGVLMHELVHSLLPQAAKHGKEFRAVAHRIGLEGVMRHTKPTPLLKQRLQVIAANLGPLPHAKLNFRGGSDVPTRQQTRHLKAECGAKGCGYRVQISAKWAKAALPVCPVNIKHGKLVCTLPTEEIANGDNPLTATT